jgi:polyisoprenoid-binding protein YceI
MATSLRRRAMRVVLGTGAVVVLLAAAAFYWVVLRDDTPSAAALVERQVVTTERAADGELDGVWTVVPGQDVWAGYRITERVGAIDNVAVARTGHVDASLTIADAEVTKVRAEVDMTTLKSQDSELPGVGGRDKAMRGEGLETDLHPTATFTLTEPIDLGHLPEPGTKVTAQAIGLLDLHGVERPVTIPVEARWNGQVIDLTGSVDVDLADHEIDPPAPQVVTVAGTGTLELQLTFRRK